MSKLNDSSLSSLEIMGFTDSQPKNLKKRYRQLSAIYQTDNGGNNKMMKRINKAYLDLA